MLCYNTCLFYDYLFVLFLESKNSVVVFGLEKKIFFVGYETGRSVLVYWRTLNDFSMIPAFYFICESL